MKGETTALQIVIGAVILLVILVVVLFIFRGGVNRASNTTNTQLDQTEACAKDPTSEECNIFKDLKLGMIFLPWFIKKQSLLR
jgi:hypothetical protein